MNEICWIDIFTALLTPTIAIGVMVIAFLQWQTAENLRKQQLFDKRYAFFNRIWGMFSAHIYDPNTAPLETQDLLDYIDEAGFLFGKDIKNHLLAMPKKQKEDSLNYPWFSAPFAKYMNLK